MTHKKSNNRDFDFKKPYIEDIVGSVKYKKIIFESQLFPDTKYSCEAVSTSIPRPSLNLVHYVFVMQFFYFKTTLLTVQLLTRPSTRHTKTIFLAAFNQLEHISPYV